MKGRKRTGKKGERRMKREIASITLVLMLFVSMFLSLPLVSAACTVENPYMPLDSDDWKVVFAMKTETDGYFYVPNAATDLLKAEILFDCYAGDQDGGASPYGSIENYPDGKINMKDVGFVASHFGKVEGDEGWNYMADVIADKIVDMRDISLVGSRFGCVGLTFITSLTGVTVTFVTGETESPDDYGYV